MTHAVRGSDKLAQQPDFRLIGRDDDLDRIFSILMRKRANSLIIVGPSGIGISSILLGLQAAKKDPNTPFDIVSKRLFFLDVDSLFSSGDSKTVNDEFQKIVRQLHVTPESVLIIENTLDFIEASRVLGCSHFVQVLNHAVKSDKTQLILGVRNEDLSLVLKWHTDFQEHFTLYDLTEPNKQDLFAIVRAAAEALSTHHKVGFTDDAIRACIELTTKYRGTKAIRTSQPTSSINLLDRSFSSFRQSTHKSPPILAQLEQQINGEKDEKIQKTLLERYKHEEEAWNDLQRQINAFHSEQRSAEEEIFKLEDELEEERERHKKDGSATTEMKSFAEMASGSGFDSEKAEGIKKRIGQFQELLRESTERHDSLVKRANEGLVLDRKDVVLEFAKITKISTDQLNEDETKKLRDLEENLKSRVFGQDAAIKRIADSIKVSRLDPMKDAGPATACFLMGPSGVGKTETALSVAQFVMGREDAVIRFDMSEYMEKHAVAKLIGAPPGYEGFEAGGILTNTVRDNPVGVYLFDEVEKAHPDIFKIFLQILSAGRLTDNIGRVVDFSETIIIWSSNIGQQFYLDADLTDADAERLATQELESIYPSELLNRFNGRRNILHYKRLTDDIIIRIIKREINKLNSAYEPRGVRIEISDEDIKMFCAENYDIKTGARGLPGYIKENLRPVIVDQLLQTPGAKGVFSVRYADKRFNVTFKEQ